MGHQLYKMYWLIGRRSQLSTENKLLLYKSIIKPIWTYSIQLWGTASNSNIEILQRYQSKLLRIIVDAPWYITNKALRRDLQIPTIKEEVRRYSQKYQKRLEAHPNSLAVNLMKGKPKRRLKRKIPQDLLI